MLAKSPGFTGVAVLSLALGIGANTAIFTLIKAVFLNPLPVEDASTLVQIYTVDKKTIETNATFTLTPTSLPNYVDYSAQNTVFNGLAAFTFTGLAYQGDGAPEQLPGVLASGNYFDVLGVRAVLGRTFTADDDKSLGGSPVAVLSHSIWTKRFGANPDLINQTIKLNSQSFTVIGVTPPNFKGTFTIGNPDIIWIPFSMREELLTGQIKNLENFRRFRWLNLVARLKPGVTMGQAEASLQTIAATLEREYPVDNGGRTIRMASLADSALGINQRRQFVLAGSVLQVVVGLVLLIACANLANLLLAQSTGRSKELSLRAALGAGRGRLLRQMLTESVVLAMAGGALGLLMAYWGLELLWSFRPPFLGENSIQLTLDARVLAFTAGISLFTGIVFGLAPAVRASSPNLSAMLNAGGRSGTFAWTRNPLRSMLVIAEVALALVALVGAGLFLRSMQNVQKVDPGFESSKLFTLNFDLTTQRYEMEPGKIFFRQVIERVRNVPGVEAAAVASNGPLQGGILRTYHREGQEKVPNARGTLILTQMISTTYFETMRIPFLSGRNITPFDKDGTTPVAVVNAAMAARLWPGESAVGKRVSYVGDTTLREVVGIVHDAVVGAIGEDPQPVAYLPIEQLYVPAATLHVRTRAAPEEVMGSVRETVQSLNRNLALTNVNTIGRVLDQGLWAPRMGAGLLGLFGLLALVLSTVGIYGVMSYSVAQRTNEIGIRMTLGAQRGDVLRLVVGQGMRLALVGIGAGPAAAIAAARLINSLLFGVTGADPLTFAAVGVLFTIVALVACLVPALRATRVDPVVALRYE